MTTTSVTARSPPSAMEEKTQQSTDDLTLILGANWEPA